MLFNTVAFSALLLGSATATATIVHERSLEDGVSALYKRQYQFQPGTQTATGNTCADAFGSGYITCREQTAVANRLCYNPTAGQTCCNSSWACPNGSGCSAGSYCCPNGQDAKACAAANAVSSSASSSSSSSSIYSSSASSSAHKTKTKSSSSAAPTVYEYALPSSYSVKNVTSAALKVSATATGSYPAPTTTKVSVFEGGASDLGMSFSGLLGAGIVGVMAALF